MTEVKENKSTYLHSAVRHFMTAVMFGLPLIVTNGFFNITETKYVYYIVCAIFFIVPSFAYIFKNLPEAKKNGGIPNRKEGFTTIDLAVTAFGISVLASALFSSYPADAFLGLTARYQGAVTVTVYILVYFLVSRNYSLRQNYLFFAVAAFCVVSILGVLNCFNIDLFGFYKNLRSDYKTIFVSSIGNINFYSAYFCLLFPLVICGYSLTKKKVSRVVYSFALVVGTFGMMVTASESFAIGFCVSMLIIPLFFFSNRNKMLYFLQSVAIITVSAQLFNFVYSKAETTNIAFSKAVTIFLRPEISITVLILSIVLYIVILLFPDRMKLFEKMYIFFLVLLVLTGATLFTLSNTVGLGKLDSYLRLTADWGTYRGTIWRFCLRAYREFGIKDLLFGIGPECLQHLEFESAVFGNKTIDQAHNEYVQYIMTTGIFGILSYAGIMFATALTVIKKLRHSTLAVGIFASLAAYWVQAAVNLAQPFTTPIMYLYIAAIGGMWIQEKRTYHYDDKKETLTLK